MGFAHHRLRDRLIEEGITKEEVPALLLNLLRRGRRTASSDSKQYGEQQAKSPET